MTPSGKAQPGHPAPGPLSGGASGDLPGRRPRKPLPHAAHERHAPRIRRRRRRRVRKHLFLRRYGIAGVILVIIAGFGAFVGGLILAAWLLQSARQAPLSDVELGFSKLVHQTCQDSMLRVDCACFWTQSREAYTEDNIAPLMQALIEREQWGPALTRGRMEKVAGPEATRQIGRALYDCVQM